MSRRWSDWLQMFSMAGKKASYDTTREMRRCVFCHKRRMRMVPGDFKYPKKSSVFTSSGCNPMSNLNDNTLMILLLYFSSRKLSTLWLGLSLTCGGGI